MNNKTLNWEWEMFRHKLALIEKEFIKKNKDKCVGYFDLHKALSKELKIRLGKEKEDLLNLQLISRIGKTFL